MAERIGILTGGGDCAGLNTVIASIVKAGIPMGYEFIGFEKGWEGVLDPMMYRELTRAEVRGISHLGGTFLGTTNRGRFGAKVGDGEVNRIPKDILDMAKRNLDSLGITGLIVLGGDGTLSGALQLAERGIKLIGVPKTIDNDLHSTDRTFGFSTAVDVAVDAFDKIHTTATSHQRTIFIECMGRHTGWIALEAGLAGNAHAILLPEFPFSISELAAFLKRRNDEGMPSIVCVAEGITIERDLKHDHTSSEVQLAGSAHMVMQLVEQELPGELEMRTVVLGHTQRGGSPNAADRILAKRFGVAAMQAYREGRFNHMVSLRSNQIVLQPIGEAVADLKRVTEETPELQTARALGVFVN